MLKSFTKLSMPHTFMATAMPNDIAATMSRVLRARLRPISKWLSSMSLTKLMSGTPGTMNRAQASSGCHTVSLWSTEASHVGRWSATTGMDM